MLEVSKIGGLLGPWGLQKDGGVLTSDSIRTMSKPLSPRRGTNRPS